MPTSIPMKDSQVDSSKILEVVQEFCKMLPLPTDLNFCLVQLGKII